MLMQAEEEVNKKVAAAKASADKTTREATAAAQRKVAESTKKVRGEMPFCLVLVALVSFSG